MIVVVVLFYLWNVSTVSSERGTNLKNGLAAFDARSTMLEPYALIIDIGTLDGI